jgi:hypothetical protein
VCTFPNAVSRKNRISLLVSFCFRAPAVDSNEKEIMAIYESAVARESSPPSSSFSMLLKVMDFVLCGPLLRMLQGTATPSTSTMKTTDPYARMMMMRNNNNDDHRHNKATTMSVRMISFWVCFAAVALAYSKRNISVDVWRTILKRPTSSPRSNSNRRNDESFQETVEAVYALCRRLIRCAVDAVLETSQRRREQRGQDEKEPHDLSPAQHRGSCHCGAVQFVVFGPKTLYVESATSTATTTTTTTMNAQQYNRRIVPYEYARIDTTSLTWDEGNVQAYAARFFFCPRCGVHLAHADAGTTSHHHHAAEEDAQRLYINVDCLDGDSYILRPIRSRPPEETTHSLLRHRPNNMDDVIIPLTVPVPVIATADHHHYGMVSDGGSMTMTSKQPQQQYRCAPSSPSVSALEEEDLELLSTTMDGRSIVLGNATSVASSTARTTNEDLAVTAYRLRKALSSHTTSTTTISTTTAKISSPVSSSLSSSRAAVATAPPPTASAGSETKGDDDIGPNDDDDDDDDDEEDKDIDNTPDESSSPVTYRAAETDGSPTLSMTSDADQLRRYLAKHG